MYNNFIYFLLILLIYTTYQPAGEPVSLWLAVFGLIFLPGMFWLIVRQQFHRLKQFLEFGLRRPGAQDYHRLVFRMSALAIMVYAVHVYLLGLKDLVLLVPGLKSSSILVGLWGLSAFALYLSLLWREAHGAYSLMYSSRLSRASFVASQLRFNLPVVVPYLLLSLITDLIALLPDTGLKAWLNSPLGDTLFVMIFMVVLLVVFPALVRPLWGLKPLEASPARTIMENFCRRYDFEYRDIMLWPLNGGEGLTAGVMGLTRRWRYIIITRSLLQILDEEELEAVLGHEIGHVKRRHLLLYLFFLLGYLLLISTWSELSIYLLLISDKALDLWISSEGRPSTAVSVMMGLPLFILMIVYFRFIFGAFIRNFERQADLFSFSLSGSNRGLVGSLEKIAWYAGNSRDLPSWHHYSVAQRVHFLQASAANPGLISGHERKVKLMLWAYVIFVGLAVAGGLAIQGNEWGRNLHRRLVVNALEAETRRSPQNPQTLRLLGDMYYETGRQDEAIVAYERARRLSPLDPEILNNLAWTLLTRPSPSRADKSRALELAAQAANIKPVAHILDTLAEALYATGDFKKALAIIQQAMDRLDPGDDPEHYLKQKKKIETALGSRREI